MTKIKVFQEDIIVEDFDVKNLPSDIHLVSYMLDGNLHVDAVRACTMVDIVDAYYDKLKGKGEVVKIESGYGRIRPNLYGKIYKTIKMRNSEYIAQLQLIVAERSSKLTIMQLKQLIAKYA